MNTLTAPRDAGQANGAGGLDVGQRFKATDSDGTAVLEIGAHEPGRGLLGARPAHFSVIGNNSGGGSGRSTFACS